MLFENSQPNSPPQTTPAVSRRKPSGKLNDTVGESPKSVRNSAVGLAEKSLPSVLRKPVAPPIDEPVPDLKDKLVVVVDAHSLIYQVFHALPPMTSGGGLPVSAVYGFVGDMLELIERKQPEYLIAAFDKSEITFRNDLYPKYKANRDSMPDELRQQIPLIRQAIDAMGIAIIEQAGYEADDLLATVADKVEVAGGRCLIVTSDKDCRQLISDQTHLYNIRKHQEIDASELWDLWGVRPDQVVDYQALVGDPVDNVPGIALIGPKMAQSLLEQHDTLDAVLDNAASISGRKRKENLMNGREAAMLSRDLVRLRRDVESPIAWSRASRDHCDLDRADALLQEFGFRRLRQRLQTALGDGDAEPEQMEWKTNYQIIESIDQLHELVGTLQNYSRLAIDTETTSTHARGCDLVGISIAWEPESAAYIPIRAPKGDPQLEQNEVIDALRELLESSAIEKVGHNIKFDMIVLRSAGVRLGGVTFDTMVADYLIDAGGRNHTLDDMARRRLSHQTTSI
ncbi:MAG: 5'-3' exonuclease H3TH domain-containing protein, partial [Planctomycetota bacterium]